jgi:hypothetical protein
MDGECDVVSRHLQGCSPHLRWLRTDGLAPASKCWTYSHARDMGTVSLVACHQQMFGLSLLLQCLYWERNWGKSHRPLSRADRWSWKHFFSGAVVSVQRYWWLTKGCYTRTMWDMYVWGPYMDWAWKTYGVLIRFSLQSVHRFELPWLSDMSNCLFVAVRM